MINVPARHKHPLGAYINTIAAHRAGWWLHFNTLLFAMFFFYFYIWQFLYGFNFGFLFLLSQSFLLWNSSNNFEDSFLVKALVEVLHEITWVKLIVCVSHSQKLVACEKIHERPHQTINKILNMRSLPLCSSCIVYPASLHKNKLRRW